MGVVISDRSDLTRNDDSRPVIGLMEELLWVGSIAFVCLLFSLQILSFSLYTLSDSSVKLKKLQKKILKSSKWEDFLYKIRKQKPFKTQIPVENHMNTLKKTLIMTGLDNNEKTYTER